MKVKVIREHLENQVAISDLCERYQLHPNQVYKWKKELFEGAVKTFSGQHKKERENGNRQTQTLEAKLRKREGLIAELLEENVALKKSTYGER